ncbi:MAG: hypothetical protein RL228_920 [Actinomycetota bacterium]|jgi:hypothetical protein
MSNQDQNFEKESNDVFAAEKLLSNALGGKSGFVDSGLPTLVFLSIWTFNGRVLQSALIAAGAVGVLLAILRLLQKKSLQQVLGGLIGLAVSAYFANRSGEAKDFFLPSILKNLGYGSVILLSIILRHPIVGYIVGGLKGDLTGWRKDPDLLKFYSLITWWWVGLFAVRLLFQIPLFLTNQVQLLGTLNATVLGFPIYLAVVWVTYRALKNRGIY